MKVCVHDESAMVRAPDRSRQEVLPSAESSPRRDGSRQQEMMSDAPGIMGGLGGMTPLTRESSGRDIIEDPDAQE